MSLVDSILRVQLLEQLVVLGLLLEEHDALLVVSLPALQVRDVIIFQNRLLVNLLHPALELLVLIQKQLSIVGSLGGVVRRDQLLQLHFELLVLQSVLLDLNLPVLELVRGLLELVLRLSELVAFLLEHV